MIVNEVSNVNRFYGTDTYGTSIEVGVKDGNWYSRHYGFNGYGKGWTKWVAMEPQKTFINEHGKTCIKWGWNYLTGYHDSPIRIRKPK